MCSKSLRIAYLCDQSPLDRNLYSGGNARMYDALCKHAGDVTILGKSWHAAEPFRRLIEAAPESVNLRARWRAHLALARLIARGVRAELAAGDFDVVFGAYSFQSLFRLAAPKHLVTAFTSDATQTIYRTSEIGKAFESQFPGGRVLDGWIESCEQAVFQSCDLLFWPSSWLRDAAVERYALDPKHNHMIPWGANIERPPTPGIREISETAPARLLLIGRDWFAKGGPLAFETMMALRARGVDAMLTVIGCVPPEFHVNDWVTVHPSLDKSVPEQMSQFNDALAPAHFMVQPSYESYGFAFCEASAHGLPSLCFQVGGVPVFDGRNGHTLPTGSPATDFASIISWYLRDPEAYAALALRTREEYETRLNWDAWGRSVAGLLNQEVARKRHPRPS